MIIWDFGLRPCVDCPKITEDKSSKSIVQTPDARLIIATSAAPRREGWNPRLNIITMTKMRSMKARLSITAVPRRESQKLRLCFTAMAKTQSLKLASQSSMQYLDAEPEARVSREAWRRTWSSRFSSVTSTTKREAQSPRLGYNCPHY